jgi:glycosyltransferase involved in cell wall biosynthesis
MVENFFNWRNEMSNPKVSIGLPVYNAENFLNETMESLLAQTYSDFELIISDNASTDGTEAICRTYAESDDRIRYYRQEENAGASANHNWVLQAAKGEYFKWAAHDDLLDPTFLGRCVEVLDGDPEVVLTYSRVKAIDGQGNVLFTYKPKPMLNSNLPHERLFECICVAHAQSPIFGVFRKSALQSTRLLQPFSSSDRVLLGEITLRGRVFEIPDPLFFYRLHPNQSWQAYPDRYSREAWFDPSRIKRITFPHWRLLQEHFISVVRSPRNLSEKALCMGTLVSWVRFHWRPLANNLILRELPE